MPVCDFAASNVISDSTESSYAEETKHPTSNPGDRKNWLPPQKLKNWAVQTKFSSPLTLIWSIEYCRISL